MSIKSRVKYFLEKVASTSQNDNLLIALMWAEDLVNNKRDETPSSEEENKDLPEKTKKFLRCLADGELTNFDSIRKAKGIVLREHPELKYENRNRATKVLEKELNT